MRHTLDVMHIERNVMDNILRTMLGDKDTPAVRKTCESYQSDLVCGCKSGMTSPPGTKLKPHAPYATSLIGEPNRSFGSREMGS